MATGVVRPPNFWVASHRLKIPNREVLLLDNIIRYVVNIKLFTLSLPPSFSEQRELIRTYACTKWVYVLAKYIFFDDLSTGL